MSTTVEDRRAESRKLAEASPDYARRMRIQEILLRWLLHLYKKGGERSIDPEIFHRAIPFLLFEMATVGFRVTELALYRDIVSHRYMVVQEVLVDLVGTFLKFEQGGRHDDHFHFTGAADLTIDRMLRGSFGCYLSDLEIEIVEDASRAGTAAYKSQVDFWKVLKDAGLRD